MITTTLSKTLWSSASWRVESRWAVHAMVFDFPDPAECWIRYDWPGTVGGRVGLQLAAPRPTGGTAGRSPTPSAPRALTEPLSGRSTWMKRCRMSSQASRAQTRSHRYEVLCPLGFGGLPLPRLWPWLNGRNRVAFAFQLGGHRDGSPGRPRSGPAPGGRG